MLHRNGASWTDKYPCENVYQQPLNLIFTKFFPSELENLPGKREIPFRKQYSVSVLSTVANKEISFILFPS
jgi:hypothetical protein